MDTLLMAVALTSLAIAGALGVKLAQMVREEQRRADARVELLMDLAASSEPEPQRTARFSDLDLRSASASPVMGDLFHEREEHPAWPRRLLVAGAMAVVIGAAVLAWAAIDRHDAVRSPAVTVSPARPPLELLSLAHKQERDTLVISGFVQNPRGASVLSGVQATVLVFGVDGALIASGRTPVDFTTLAAGDESPFIIRLAATGAARYRIAFRGAQDEMLAHVDRRNPDTLARKETP
jgi:hypothetical protein